MATTTRIIVTFVLAVLLGAAIGWRWIAPSHQPPPLAPSAEANGAQAAITPKNQDERDQTAANQLAEEDNLPPAKPPSPQKRGPNSASKQAPSTADEAEPATKVLVPSVSTKLRDDDIDLLPRGPDAWVIVDLASAKTGPLTIRAGSLERDGSGVWRRYAKAKRVGVLRGAMPKVRLLHLGFDRDGQPTVAHVRTASEPPVEGMIPLRVRDVQIPLRPLIVATP
ncbi:MAG: hypothetical protein KC502_21570 [Myxococcales bacterium]|nr:hypothetical protein [Myxococcales bacterium]